MRTYAPFPDSVPARAIAHLQRGELATGPLAELLDVGVTSLPSCLEAAIRHGLIVKTKREGLNWYSVGDGKPVAREEDEPLEPGRRPRPALTDGVDIDKLLHTAKTATDRPFVCGLFSDGRLVLELPGQTITLDRAQTDVLVALLDRLAA